MYLGSDHVFGESYGYRGLRVVHQDICNMELIYNPVDLVVHSDVLEHVPDFKRTLAETRRVLKTGGAAVLTALRLPDLSTDRVLSHLNPDGTITHFVDPPEYHGDPFTGSILAYYTFGWESLDNLKEVGFPDAFVTLEYNAMARPPPNNNYSGLGNMLPVVVAAIN